MPNPNSPGQLRKLADPNAIIQICPFLTAFAVLTRDGKVWFYDHATGLHPLVPNQPAPFVHVGITDQIIQPRVRIMGITAEGDVWFYTAADPSTGIMDWHPANLERH